MRKYWTDEQAPLPPGLRPIPEYPGYYISPGNEEDFPEVWSYFRRGHVLGNPGPHLEAPAVRAELQQEILRRHRQGRTIKAIGSGMGIPVPQVRDVLLGAGCLPRERSKASTAPPKAAPTPLLPMDVLGREADRLVALGIIAPGRGCRPALIHRVLQEASPELDPYREHIIRV